MAELMDWFRQAQEGALHPLIAIGIFIVVFLEIHPFQDGNGRLSRVLTTLLLLRAGYAYVPYSSLERFIEQSVIEQSKEGYYLALRRTQGTIRTEAPDWTPWLTFFLKALQRQMRRLRGKVERERLLLAKLPDLAIQILDHARDHGRVTIADAVAITGASRNTLKLHFKTLRERGLLALHGQGRGAWYSLP
jgi:Fic family protein